jgi:hypothetical protein
MGDCWGNGDQAHGQTSHAATFGGACLCQNTPFLTQCENSIEVHEEGSAVKRIHPASLTAEQAKTVLAGSRADFDGVLAAGYALDRYSSGQGSTFLVADVGSELFTKSLAHMTSIGQIAPSPGDAKPRFDFISVAVLLRSLAETYLVFRYTCMEPRSRAELEFREALLDYHHCCKHSILVVTMPSSEASSAHAAERKKAAGERLAASPLFLGQRKDRREKQMKGKEFMHRTQDEIAAAANLDEHRWTGIYTYLSQLAHASPMSVKLMRVFEADKPVAPGTMAWLLNTTASVMSKFIVDMDYLFPRFLERLREVDRSRIVRCARNIEQPLPT